MEVISLKAKPKLVISDRIMQTIAFLHSKEDVEWSGLLFYSVKEGSIDEPEKLLIRVEDLYLMDVGSHSYTEYDFGAEMMDVYDKIPQANPIHCIDNGLEPYKMGHIHTHHSMPTFFSGEDMGELKNNAGAYNYYLSLIVNFKRDYEAKIAISTTVESDRKFNYRGPDGGKKFFQHSTEVEAIMTLDCEIIHEGVDVVEERYEELKEIAAKKTMISPVVHHNFYPKHWDNEHTPGVYDWREHNKVTGGEDKKPKKGVQTSLIDEISSQEYNFSSVAMIEFLRMIMGADKNQTVYACLTNLKGLKESDYINAIDKISSRVVSSLESMSEDIQTQPIDFMSSVCSFLDNVYPNNNIAQEVYQCIFENIIEDEDE
jgi:hypothetical protein